MLCPCHSGKPYKTCCAPFHKGLSPPSPLALMRSRYSAYALGKVAYIIQTTHPEKRSSDSKSIQLFCENTHFKNLEILSVEEGSPFSYVTFRATLFQGKEDVSFTERSQFTQVDGKWCYQEGTFLSS